MTGIILNEMAQNGIQGTSIRKSERTKEYQRLVDEANERIEEDLHEYADAYRKASAYLAR